MKTKNFLVIIMIIALSACATPSVHTAVKYKDFEKTTVNIANGKCFSIQHNASARSAFVDECLAVGAGKDFLAGLTFGIIDLAPPPSWFEESLLIYLNEPAQKSINPNGTCKIIRSNIINAIASITAGYEIFYECPTD